MFVNIHNIMTVLETLVVLSIMWILPRFCCWLLSSLFLSVGADMRLSAKHRALVFDWKMNSNHHISHGAQVRTWQCGEVAFTPPGKCRAAEMCACCYVCKQFFWWVTLTCCREVAPVSCSSVVKILFFKNNSFLKRRQLIGKLFFFKLFF